MAAYNITDCFVKIKTIMSFKTWRNYWIGSKRFSWKTKYMAHNHLSIQDFKQHYCDLFAYNYLCHFTYTYYYFE